MGQLANQARSVFAERLGPPVQEDALLGQSPAGCRPVDRPSLDEVSDLTLVR